MPASVRAVGGSAIGSGAVNPALPSGTAADDILILAVESDASGTITAPAGYAHISGSPFTVGSGATGSLLGVMWKRAIGGEVAPTVADSGDHTVARIIGIQGCIATGDPVHQVAADTAAVASTAVTFPAVTTTYTNTLILNVLAAPNPTSSASQISSQTNASLSGLAERMDTWTTTGNDGGFLMISGSLSSAGASGSTTTTLAESMAQARVTLALWSTDSVAAGISGSASGSVGIVGSGAAAVGVSGASSGTLGLAGTVAGRNPVAGAGVGGLSLVGSAVAANPIAGIGAGQLDVLGSTAATTLIAGTGSGGMDLTAAAAGRVGLLGTGAGAVSIAGAAEAVGQVTATGAAAGDLSLVGASQGEVAVAGAASGVIALGGALTGAVAVSGGGSGSVLLAGAGVGSALSISQRMRSPTASRPTYAASTRPSQYTQRRPRAVSKGRR